MIASQALYLAILGMVFVNGEKFCVQKKVPSGDEITNLLEHPCRGNNTLSRPPYLNGEIHTVEEAVLTLCKMEVCSPELVDVFLCQPPKPTLLAGEKEPLFCFGCGAPINVEVKM